MMKHVRVGVVGAGYITALMHAPQLQRLQDRFRFAGICDLNQERAKDIAGRFGPRVYPDFNALLDDPDIELVIVATKPDSLHADMAVQALRAHKHVLVDKPMANSSADCDRMIATARTEGKVLGVNHSCRWCLDFLMTKEVIAKGALGKIRLIKNYWIGSLNGFGSMLHVGCHTLDQSLQLHTGKIVEITALAESKDQTLETAGCFDATLRFEDGVILQTGMIPYVAGSELYAPVLIPHFYVMGEQDVFALNWMNYATNVFEQISGFARAKNRYQALPDFLRVDLAAQSVHESLYHAIREGKPPAVTAEEGRRVIRVLELIFEASQKGETLRVNRE